MKKNMARFHDLKVEVVNQPNDEIRNHISRTVLGTPGGIMYRQVGAVNKLNSMGQVYFMNLRKSTRLLGTAGLAHRMVNNGSKTFSSYYIRYFSIFAPLRVKSYKEKKKELKERQGGESSLLKNSPIRDKVIHLFDNMADLNDESIPPEVRSFSYAFIEKENYRSMDFSSMIGYVTTREVATILFSRFFPKRKKNVDFITPEEKPEILNRLQERYAGYTAFFKDHIFYNDHYFVYREKGEAIAGVQANLVEWDVLEIPGRKGKLIMNIVPKLPLISRLFQPGSFKFAAFESIYYKPGYEKFLITLFESVCAILGVYVGITWLDTGSQVYEDLTKVGNLGILGKVMKSQPGVARVKFLDIPENEQKEFFEKPIYISAFDNT